MEERKKKPIMLGVIVVCLVLAGAIAYMNRPKRSGLDSIPSGQMIWVKCANSDCGAEYQIDRKGYLEYKEKHQNPMSLSAPPLVCEKCEKKSVFKAVKCEKCGLIFVYGAAPKGFADRCPECGYSKIEEQRKRGREGR